LPDIQDRAILEAMLALDDALEAALPSEPALRFEDLVRSPGAALGRTFAKLGLEAAVPPEVVGRVSRSKPPENRLLALSPEERAHVEHVCGRLYQRHGYLVG
jgi:hypothetical protein